MGMISEYFTQEVLDGLKNKAIWERLEIFAFGRIVHEDLQKKGQQPGTDRRRRRGSSGSQRKGRSLSAGRTGRSTCIRKGIRDE